MEEIEEDGSEDFNDSELSENRRSPSAKLKDINGRSTPRLRESLNRSSLKKLTSRN